MPEYFYSAKSLKGESKTGILFAKNQSELARILHSGGYFLISAKEEGSQEKKSRAKGVLNINLPFFDRLPPLSEKIFFARNLEVMVAAGISLPRAIRVLGDQTRNKKFKDILHDISEQIVRGNNFSEALKKYPEIFPEIFQSMIRVGEETGTLENVLRSLTEQMEKEYELRSKIKGAMIYPSVILFAMIAVGILMMIMVVPSLAETFEEIGAELPMTTRVVISIAYFLQEQWLLSLLIVFIVFFSLRFVLKTKAGKRFTDSVVLKIPIIGTIIRKTNSAYTTRGLSSLFSSGVPIVKSLEITSSTLSNIYFREALSLAAQKVQKGGKLSEALAPYTNLYPLMVVQMIEVGEETGETSEILKKLAEFFEEEVSNATKNLSAIIEPALMLIIGTVIGFFAVSMVQPMYSMLQSIQ